MILLLLLGNIFIYLEKLVQRYHYVTFDSIFTGNLYLLMLCLQLMLTKLEKNTPTKSKIPFVLCTFYYEIMMKQLYFCDLLNKMQHSFHICTT